ncbi:MAG: tetratricopeptide repeat protein [Cyclobacteriaceae bacterium]
MKRISLFTLCLILSLALKSQSIPSAGVTKIEMENISRQKVKYMNSIADIISYGFISIPNVEFKILNHKNAQKQSGKKGGESYVINAEASDVENLTYRIEGTIRDYSDEFSLSFRIYENKRGASEPIVIRTVYGFWTYPLIAFSELNEQIGIEISKLQAQQSNDLKVAIIGTSLDAESPIDSILISELVYDFTVDLIPTRQVKLVPFEKCQSLFYKDYNASMYQQLGADLILLGKLAKNQNGDIEIFTSLHIKELDSKIELAPALLRYDLVYDYMSPIQNQFNDLIEYIAEEDLSLNYPHIDKLSDSDSKSYNELVKDARDYRNKNDLFIASHLLNKAIQSKPDKSAAYLELSKVRYTQGRLEEAILHANLSVKFQNKNIQEPNVEIFLGKLFLENKEYYDALIHLEKVHSENPGYLSEEYGDLNYFYGKALFHNAYYTDAISFLKESLIKTDDTDLEAKYLIGMSHFYYGENKNAIEYLSEVSQTEEYEFALSDLTDAYYYLGYDKHIDGKNDSAEYYALKGVEIGNFSYSNYTLLLLAYNEQKKFEDSYRLVEDKILDGIFDREGIYRMQGNELRYQFGRSDNDIDIAKQAIRYFKLYTETVKDDSDVLFNLGNLHSAINENETSIAFYEEALKYEDDISYYLDLAEVYIKLSYPEKVEPLFENLSHHKSQLRKGTSNRLLQLYLECSALSLLGVKNNKKEKELLQSLEEGSQVSGWNYDSFKIWTETVEDEEIKNYLQELTSKMESNTSS